MCRRLLSSGGLFDQEKGRTLGGLLAGEKGPREGISPVLSDSLFEDRRGRWWLLFGLEKKPQNSSRSGFFFRVAAAGERVLGFFFF